VKRESLERVRTEGEELSRGIVVLSAWIDRSKVLEELSRELEKKRKKKRFQQFQTVYVYRVEQTSIPTRLTPRTGQHITWMSKSEGGGVKDALC